MELANKNILESLKKRLDEAKGLWVEKLPSTLWELRTTTYLGTRNTPFNLAFSSDTIIPVEIGINSLKVAHFDLEQNESSLQANLDLLEEIREETSVKMVVRQRQVAQYYNKRAGSANRRTKKIIT